MIRSMSLATALVLTLIAAACSGGDDDNSATSDPAATPTASSAAALAVAARPSAGCTQTAPPAGVSEQTLAVGAETGSYRQMIPSAAADARPLPLIIDVHGLGTPAADEAAITGFEALGEHEGAYVLTPAGLGPPPGNNSIEFLTELLDASEQRLCIDTARVFMGGMSLGGRISSIVGCQLEDRIAAIGVASGLAFPTDCSLSRPLPVMTFHGKLDVVTQYYGGQGYTSNPDIAARTPPAAPPADTTAFGQDWPRVEAIVAQWAEANGCLSEPEATQVAEHVELRTFVGCADGSAVAFYVIEDGQHAWPGTDLDTSERTCGDCVAERFLPTQEIQATQLLWEFWMQHPLVGGSR